MSSFINPQKAPPIFLLRIFPASSLCTVCRNLSKKPVHSYFPKALFLWMTKPRCSGNYANDYIYSYVNDMLAAKPMVMPHVATLEVTPMNTSRGCQQLYTTTPTTTPTTTSTTAPVIHPQLRTTIMPINYFHGGFRNVHIKGFTGTWGVWWYTKGNVTHYKYFIPHSC